MQETSKDELVRVRDVASILGISISTAYRYVNEYGLIPTAAYEVYGNNKTRRLFRVSDIQKLRTPQLVEA